MKSIRHAVNEVKAILYEDDEVTTGLKPGDIMVSIWGHDVDIVDFYRVVSRKEKSVVLVKIGKKKKALSWQHCTVLPDESTTRGPQIRRKIGVDYKGEEDVKIEKGELAKLWKGQPVEYSGQR